MIPRAVWPCKRHLPAEGRANSVTRKGGTAQRALQTGPTQTRALGREECGVQRGSVSVCRSGAVSAPSELGDAGMARRGEFHTFVHGDNCEAKGRVTVCELLIS